MTEPLRSKLARGFRWNVVGQTLSQVLYAVSTIILARRLTPSEFSFAAIGFSVLTLLLAFFGQGFAIAVMARGIRDDEGINTIFTFYFGLAILAGGLLALIAVPVERFYRQPGLAVVCVALAIQASASILSYLPKTLLDRDFRFPRVNAVLVARTVVGSSSAIALALSGWGFWALIGSSVAASVFEMVAYYVAAQHRPRFCFSLKSFRSIARFGTISSVTDVLNTAVNKGDYLILGRVWAKQTLGIYFFAFEKSTRAFDLVLPKFLGLVMPALSALNKDSERLRQGFLEVTRVSIAVTLPIAVGLMVTGSTLVPLIFGQQWRPAVPAFIVLTAIWIPRSFGAAVSILLYALERPRYGLYNAILRLVLLIPFFLAAAFFLSAPVVVACGIVILSIVTLTPYYAKGYDAAGVTLGEVIFGSWRTLLGSGLALAGGLVAERLAAANGAGEPARLLAALAGLAMAGTPLLWLEGRALYALYFSKG